MRLIAYFNGQMYCTQRSETGMLFTGTKSPLNNICGNKTSGANCIPFSTDATPQPTKRARPEEVIASNQEVKTRRMKSPFSPIIQYTTTSCKRDDTKITGR